jgi:hypothetical protein
MRVENGTYPTPDMSRPIRKDHVETTPKAGHQACKAGDEPEQDRERHQVTQGLSLKETGECISLHGLKDVVLCIVEDFRVVSAFFFDGTDDSIEHRLRENDFSLRSGQDESVQDLLGAGFDVGSCYSVAGRVGVCADVC